MKPHVCRSNVINRTRDGMLITVCEICGRRGVACPTRRYRSTPIGARKALQVFAPLAEPGAREVPGDDMDLSLRPDDGRFLNIG